MKRIKNLPADNYYSLRVAINSFFSGMRLPAVIGIVLMKNVLIAPVIIRLWEEGNLNLALALAGAIVGVILLDIAYFIVTIKAIRSDTKNSGFPEPCMVAIFLHGLPLCRLCV